MKIISCSKHSPCELVGKNRAFGPVPGEEARYLHRGWLVCWLADHHWDVPGGQATFLSQV